VSEKFGYLGVLGKRKTVINVPHSFGEGCLLVSHIYGCGRIYLKNGVGLGLDKSWELLFVEGMDWGMRILEMNFWDFWWGGGKEAVEPKSLDFMLDWTRSKNEPWFAFSLSWNRR